jgi:hypothetical protein
MVNKANVTLASGPNSTITDALDPLNMAKSRSPNTTVASAVNVTILVDVIKATVLNTTNNLVERLAAHILNGTLSDEIQIAVLDAAWKIVDATFGELASA